MGGGERFCVQGARSLCFVRDVGGAAYRGTGRRALLKGRACWGVFCEGHFTNVFNTRMHSPSLSPAARDAPVIDRNRPNDEIREEDAGDRHPDDPHATV